MPRIRTIAVVPTMFTLGNLVCGFFAIVVASRIVAPTEETDVTPATSSITIRDLAQAPRRFDREDPTQNVMLSSWLILLAMVFDALDGRVARMARQTSDFGAQLDSLCDAVSFGIAPGFLMVKMCPAFTFEHRNLVWMIAATFAACAALRLARFNVETTEKDDHAWFSGLPTPAAAGAIAGFALLFYNLRSAPEQRQFVDEIVQWLLPVFVVILSLLMVSRIPYPHPINQFIRGQRSLGHVVGLIFAAIPVLVIPGYSLPALAAVYVLAPPLLFFRQWLHQRWAQHEPIF
ncbi:MAG: CDP-diacylglycerol--serine O-phosphatidyltransferase [Planctomycetales bacterium]|nr:CDP-diacylglycerol--serine O-phosphatidyltransferase [Planctomycetales bacterium]